MCKFTRRNVSKTGGGSGIISGNKREIIPKNSKYVVQIDTNEFLDSLYRAFLVTEDRALGQTKSFVKCNFSEEMLGRVEPYLEKIAEDGYFEALDGKKLHFVFYKAENARGNRLPC